MPFTPASICAAPPVWPPRPTCSLSLRHTGGVLPAARRTPPCLSASRAGAGGAPRDRCCARQAPLLAEHAQRPVQRVRTRPGEHDREGHDDDEQIVLVPAVLDPEAVPAGGGRDRDDHRDDDRQCAERRQEPEAHEDAAAELPEAGEHRPESTGPDPQILEVTRGPGDPAAKPPEELLA